MKLKNVINMTLASNLYEGEAIVVRIYRFLYIVCCIYKINEECKSQGTGDMLLHLLEIKYIKRIYYTYTKLPMKPKNIINISLATNRFRGGVIAVRIYRFCYIVYMLLNILKKIDKECKQ